MLDIGWSELLLVAVVAIVVIGPKDLPDALRALGRTLTKVRRMAGEFQGQFNAALREANLEDVKKEFDTIRDQTSVLKGGFNPLDIARNEIKGAITGPAPAVAAAETSGTIDTALTSSAPVEPVPTPPPAAITEPAAVPATAPSQEPIPSAFATSSSFRR
jgi:sec-independent protein translocase protein TatB